MENMEPEESSSEVRPELVRLSLSPASSPGSLSSEEDFDPHVTTTGRAAPPTLGLRELASMRRHDRAAQKAQAKPPTGVLSGTSASATPVATGGIQLLKAVNPTDDQLPFASDVEIRGWRIVGGKRWTDQARVGAYVVFEIIITLRVGGTMTLLRRYTDFVLLHNALLRVYPDLKNAIPPIPPKKASRFSERVLESRKVALQRFLRGVMLHPVMGRAGDEVVVGEWVLGKRATNGQSVQGGSRTAQETPIGPPTLSSQLSGD